MKKFMLYAAKIAAFASVFLAGMFAAVMIEYGCCFELIMGLALCAIAIVLAFVLHNVAEKMETEEEDYE